MERATFVPHSHHRHRIFDPGVSHFQLDRAGTIWPGVRVHCSTFRLAVCEQRAKSVKPNRRWPFARRGQSFDCFPRHRGKYTSGLGRSFGGVSSGQSLLGCRRYSFESGIARSVSEDCHSVRPGRRRRGKCGLRSVLVVVSDASLGGTSRSAIAAARAWQASGWKVALLPAQPLAPAREAAVESLGTRIIRWDDLIISEFDIVHLHHGAWTAASLHHLRFLKQAAKSASRSPSLLTHNVFGVPDSILDGWPASRATAVLGQWSAMQYRLSSGRSTSVPFVVPNPQDDEFFAPPSVAQRSSAVTTFALGDGPQILRVGSPHSDKWSFSYARLAHDCMERGVGLTLLGIPAGLAASLPESPHIAKLAPVASDEAVRAHYWAADCMAVDALRGESFGNVIIESLLSGTPVVYRARPLRDNTPWEFQEFEHFHYCRSESEWRKTALEVAERSKEHRRLGNRELLVAEYGLGSVGRKLAAIGDELVALNCSQAQRLVPPRLTNVIPMRDQALCRLTHNPLATRLRELKLELRGKGLPNRRNAELPLARGKLDGPTSTL